MSPHPPDASSNAKQYDHLGLEVLADDECRALLAAAAIGRVGLSLDALPVVLPVNYTLFGESILIRSAEGTKLGAAWKGSVVAFEIDDYDPACHTGWSVLVQGTARVLSSPQELDEAGRQPLAPWALHDGGAFVAISCDIISGRRITGWHPLPGVHPSNQHAR
jgi:hypothetical protein